MQEARLEGKHVERGEGGATATRIQAQMEGEEEEEGGEERRRRGKAE
jgi:hypothetical protein